MLIKDLGYTITLSDLKTYDGVFKTLQYTLNPYQVPAARHTYDTIKDVKSDLFIHAEFYHALPRWLFYKEEAKMSLLSEIVQIFYASVKNPHIKGLVLHVESPFPKEAIKYLWLMQDNLDILDWEAFFEKYSSSKMYLSPEELREKLKHIISVSNNLENFLTNIYEVGINEFVMNCNKIIPQDIIEEATARIYLENTTKPCCFKQPYSNEFITNMVRRVPYLLGFAFDEEHSFALGDTSCFIKPERSGTSYQWPNFLEDINLLIHYNVPPLTVLEGSRKDLHSGTSLFDEGINTNFHLNVLELLTKKNVSFVREVKQATMLKEISKLDEYNKHERATDITNI